MRGTSSAGGEASPEADKGHGDQLAGVLVERERVLDWLAELAADAGRGRGRLVFVGGEAGAGKTSVVSALADAAAGSLSVRRGVCDHVSTPAALGALVDALPELSDALDDVALSRQRLFREISAVLAATPTLLLVEDIHWADEATLDMLRFAARRVGELPLLILATFRDDEVPAAHPLTGVLGDLATARDVERIHLPALSVMGVRQLLARAGSSLSAADVFRRTGGNPFYITELLSAESLDLPVTIRDAVLARTSRLTTAAGNVVAAAAVVGRRVDISLLVAVSGEPASAVDEAVASGVLVQDARGVAFRHDLAMTAVDGSLTASTRVALHAAALNALLTNEPGEHLHIARHAAACGDGAVVAAHAPLAAARASRLGAHRAAAAQYRLALQFQCGADDSRARLFNSLSYELYLTDQLGEAHAACREALHLAEQAHHVRGIGAAQRWLSRLSWYLGRTAEAEHYAGLAIGTLEPLGDSHELAMAYSNLAQLRMLAGHTEQAVEWSERAIALARKIGDHETEIHALNNMGTARAVATDDARGWRHLHQSLTLGLTHDAHDHVGRAYGNLGSAALLHRRPRDAEHYLRTGIAYALDRDLDSCRQYQASWLGRALVDQGRYDDAAEVLAEVMRRPRLPAITQISAYAAAALLAMRRGEGTPAYLAHAIELAETSGEAQRLVSVATASAEASWIAGSDGDIVRAVDRAWAAAVASRRTWDVGELSWWLQIAGVRRDTPVPVAEPFALLLDGNRHAAADAWTELGHPLWAALALSRSPNVADARHALEIIDELGAPGVRAAVLRDRHRLGLPVPRQSGVTHPAGLTAREFDVLQLLAEGLSDAELSERLFLSKKTVGHHVSSVLRKLGQPSRSRAVAAALRLRLIVPN